MNGLSTASQVRSGSQSDTYSLARLKVIMPEIGADFYAPASAGFISFATAEKWAEDLAFILQLRGCEKFQIQCTLPDGRRLAVDYQVKADGSIYENGSSGGIDYSALPVGTTVRLYVNLNYQSAQIDEVNDYIRRRGWGTDGHAVEGEPVRDRAYSKEGYGVQRGRIGTWP